MNCPRCQSPDIGIADSRPKEGNARWRRRRCERCGFRWSTIEMAAIHTRAFADLGAAIKDMQKRLADAERLLALLPVLVTRDDWAFDGEEAEDVSHQ